MTTLNELIMTDLSYCDPVLKDSFHKEARRVLKQLAGALNLDTGQYEIRANKAGIAVSGEITLHTESFYVQISQSLAGRHCDVLFRTCAGLTDFSGGANHYAPITALCNTECFAEYLEIFSQGLTCGTQWTDYQSRVDVAHFRTTNMMTPELQIVRDRFEEGTVDLADFEAEINIAMLHTENQQSIQGSLF